ncbi:MAG: UbiA family prenyltransferase [Propionibacteriaceae bacterium]|jgi:4-hydroxybenzoate polyprenyltransferase|nr:UbiA family prenyltransferase [Propionibacteriaceae bacterium]
MYFLVLLTHGHAGFELGVGEAVAGFTIFAFLLSLRVADDLKDYEADLVLFPERPLPAGKVSKRDLLVMLAVVDTLTAAANLVFVRNYLFFALLVAYGFLMSFWFFQKYRIQRSLPLALVTHNPVQLVMNAYVISFACERYGIELFTVNNLLILCTLYFPGLIWEIARKVRAPEEETEYTTYSKLFGVRKPVVFILGVMALDFVTSSILIYQLYPWAVATVIAAYAWLVWMSVRFLRDPHRFKLVDKVIVYDYLAEGSMVVFIGARLLGLGV